VRVVLVDRFKLANDIMNQLALNVTKGVYPGVSSSAAQVGSVNHSSNRALGPKFLVIFTGSNVGLNKRLEELVKLRERGCSFDVAYSGSALQILDTASINSYLKPDSTYGPDDRLIYERIIDSVQGIIAPVVTQNTAVKLALGIQDDFIPMILWRSLWLDKPIFMDIEGVLKHIGEMAKRPALEKVMIEYGQKLKSMGVKFIDNGNYIDEITKSFFGNKEASYGDNKAIDKMVLTEKDVRENNLNTKEIIVPIKAIVTPSAYDAAKERGIKIIKK
jgi:hypothetical protein